MPAYIVHMLTARSVRQKLREDSELKGDNKLKDFVKKVLENNKNYMELGSLGPDLPYYESVTKQAIDLLLKKSDKPMGVDQWSYQMHSKDPNLFPLKMIEITWKETAIEKQDWEDEDKQKFAFICGYLTHVAADQIIHPLVNLIAGPYYKQGDAREKHRQCEVYQDVHTFDKLRGSLGLSEFSKEWFNTWCDLNTGFGANAPTYIRYLVQKSFVEAHAVTPSEQNIEDWVDGILTVLRLINSIGPYKSARDDMQASSNPSARYKEYIELELPPNSPEDKIKAYNEFIGGGADKKKKEFMDFFNDAANLATVYVRAAYRLYQAETIDDRVRGQFRQVVRNADLGAPLEDGILATANEKLNEWPSP